jgi:large subunit ribosomal protein L23
MDVLIKPIVTEKITQLHEQGVYGCVVDKRANKVEIKKAIEQMYGVNVNQVRTMNVRGKVKTRYTKRGVVTGRTRSYKKALVTVAQGEFIDLYSNI